MKGLPFESTSKDIQLFFEGLYLREEDIHLAAYKDGKASGIAFAAFRNDEDARQAMFRNEKYMGKRYIELFLSSVSEMKSMLDEGVPDPKPSRLGRRNEPQDDQRSRNVSRDDNSRPKNFSDRRGRLQNRGGTERRGSNRSRSRSPRRNRSGFESQRGGNFKRGNSFRGRGNQGRSSDYGRDERHVEITSDLPSVFERIGGNARQLSEMLRNDRGAFGDNIGSGARFHRNTLGDSFGNGDDLRRKGFRSEPLASREDRFQTRDPLLDKVCVRLNELPFVISEREIKFFFKGLDVVQVKFLLHPNGQFAGKKTGEGFVEFRSMRDAKEAEKKHKEKIGKRFIDVKVITKLEMIKAIEKNDVAMRQAEVQHEEGQFAAPVSDLAIKINPNFLMQDQSTSRMLDRGLGLPNLGMTMPRQYIPMEALEAQAAPAMNKLASTAKINPDDVAAGCVVGIRNLPSSISTNELLDFFYGYSVFRDTVRIHYLAPGRSSGDAMVTLRNSREAASAIQELNHKYVGKRSVQLFLV